MNRKDNDIDGTEIARRAARQFLDDDQLVPLSVFALDHPEPIDGWASLGVEIVEDDLLRPCLRREDARRIAQERRDREQEAERQRQAEVEAPLVAVGVPALDGGSPVESLTSQDPSYKTPQEEFAGRPKPNFLEEELAAGARQLAAAKAAAEEQARRVLEGRNK